MTDPNLEGDPAEFLLSTTKYHDCFLTVGNPAVEQVEKIGVSSTHLIAHSTVFRDMLADSQLADPSGSNTHITDVSPATFKLMLRHVYGCKLPKMTPEEATNLALCADKYNIKHLVGKAAKRIKPTSAENVFPGLLCVAYINYPDLGFQVSTIIQQQTNMIVQNPKFLQLDENCLLYVVKQSVLNISELELWKSLVRWGETKVKMFPKKTLRNCLSKILHHVRLLSLTSNEILEYVLPTKILTPDEFMDLTLAVSKTHTLQSPNLCNVLQKRIIYRKDSNNEEKQQFKKKCVFNIKSITTNTGYALNVLESKSFSTLTIMPLERIEINSFTVKSFQHPMNTSFRPQTISFYISVFESSDGILQNSDYITLKHDIVPNEYISLPVNKSNGKSLILEVNKTYNFEFKITPPLPVHKIIDYLGSDNTTKLFQEKTFSYKFEDPFHILKINYSV